MTNKDPNAGIKNRWGRTRIYETIADPKLLNAKYPSPSNGLRWFVLTLDGPTSVVVSDRADAIARTVARQGGVTGVFAVNSTPHGYAVALYTTEEAALNHYRTAKAEDPEALLWWDAESVIEMGQHAIRFPLLGAWNWGKDVPLPHVAS